MNDEEIVTFALNIRAHLELMEKYLNNYENNLLQIGSIHVHLIRDINILLSDLLKSLPENKLEELVEPIITEIRERYYYLEEK